MDPIKHDHKVMVTRGNLEATWLWEKLERKTEIWLLLNQVAPTFHDILVLDTMTIL